MNNFIAISGKKEHGKDTFLNFIIKNAAKIIPNKSIAKLAFADPIKEAILNLYPQIKREHIFGESYYKSLEVNGCVNPETGNPLTIRDLILDFGKRCRQYNENSIIEAAICSANRLITEGKIVIISDCRLKKEKRYLQNNGIKVIRIIRTGIVSNSTDITEIDLDDELGFDKVIMNTNLEDFEKAAVDIINEYLL